MPPSPRPPARALRPYRLLRHPIYTSMFCLLLGTGFVITPRKRYVGSAEVRFSLM
jgi:hypothetical protein